MLAPLACSGQAFSGHPSKTTLASPPPTRAAAASVRSSESPRAPSQRLLAAAPPRRARSRELHSRHASQQGGDLRPLRVAAGGAPREAATGTAEVGDAASSPPALQNPDEATHKQPKQPSPQQTDEGWGWSVASSLGYAQQLVSHFSSSHRLVRRSLTVRSATSAPWLRAAASGLVPTTRGACACTGGFGASHKPSVRASAEPRSCLCASTRGKQQATPYYLWLPRRAAAASLRRRSLRREGGGGGCPGFRTCAVQSPACSVRAGRAALLPRRQSTGCRRGASSARTRPRASPLRCGAALASARAWARPGSGGAPSRGAARRRSPVLPRLLWRPATALRAAAVHADGPAYSYLWWFNCCTGAAAGCNQGSGGAHPLAARRHLALPASSGSVGDETCAQAVQPVRTYGAFAAVARRLHPLFSAPEPCFHEPASAR
eukprot:351126-Chlamydomonas_euryale.AAC.4